MVQRLVLVENVVEGGLDRERTTRCRQPQAQANVRVPSSPNATPPHAARLGANRPGTAICQVVTSVSAKSTRRRLFHGDGVHSYSLGSSEPSSSFELLRDGFARERRSPISQSSLVGLTKETSWYSNHMVLTSLARLIMVFHALAHPARRAIIGNSRAGAQPQRAGRAPENGLSRRPPSTCGAGARQAHPTSRRRSADFCRLEAAPLKKRDALTESFRQHGRPGSRRGLAARPR